MTLMKRKNSIFALTLLLVCILPIALNNPLVQADAGGTGKFLTITIIGEGSVTATKVKSGEVFIFDQPVQTYKVGAGTVELEAFASEGWKLSNWDGDLPPTIPPPNPTNYKTRKYGAVTAVFVKETFTITASAIGPGTIVPAGEVTVP